MSIVSNLDPDRHTLYTPRLRRLARVTNTDAERSEAFGEGPFGVLVAISLSEHFSALISENAAVPRFSLSNPDAMARGGAGTSSRRKPEIPYREALGTPRGLAQRGDAHSLQASYNPGSPMAAVNCQ